MKLTTVTVTNFKCIRNSDEFGIDPKVTTLVGKNESGKTAILQALGKLNPLDSGSGAFDELEYPRSGLVDFRDRDESIPVHAVASSWQLEADDIAAVEQIIGPGVLKSNEVRISKGYYETSCWSVEANENTGITNLISASQLFDEEQKPLLEADSVQAIKELLDSKKPSADAGGENVRSPREQELLDTINKKFPKSKTCEQAIINILTPRLPKMVYFNEYLRMPGQVSLQDLKNRPAAKQEPGNQVFAALLAMIGRTFEDLENIGQFERLQGELEGASNKLTREIFHYWSQNRHLRVQFRFEHALPKDPAPFNAGYVMRTRIENTRHGVTTSFDDRSAGFVWFFSFLVWFNQVKKNYGENLILLLDEPGLSLHAKAQADLLRYIDERLTSHQVIYTTHSPFMVHPERLSRARTVEDIFIESRDAGQPDQDIGTKVGHDVLSTDRDTLFPLQAALGYDITQTLFIGADTLLVEGPAELLYVPWFSRKLKSLGRTGLDARWTLTPCGGIDKIPSFLSLFAGQSLHIATFVDFADGVKKRVRDLRESQLLRLGHVFSADMYAGQQEADIEDVIGREAYIALVNDCYELIGQAALPARKPPKAPMRLVKEVEDHFRTNAVTGPEFDHFRPSEFLTAKGIEHELPGLGKALDRFEKLFQDLNALLDEEKHEPQKRRARHAFSK